MSRENNFKNDRNLNYKSYFAMFKEVAGLSSIISLLFGGPLFWFYCSSLGLLSTLTTSEDTSLLIVYFLLGYLLVLGGVCVTLTIIPLTLINVTEDMLEINYSKLEGRRNLGNRSTRQNDASKFNFSARDKKWFWIYGLWIFALLIQFLGLLGYLIVKGYFLPDLTTQSYLISILTVNFLIVFFILFRYKRLFNHVEKISKFTQFFYVMAQGCILALAILPIYMLIPLFTETFENNQYLFLVFYAVFFTAYSIFFGFLITTRYKSNYKDRYIIILFISAALTVMINIANISSFLNISAQAVGIQTPSNERIFYVYRFKTSDVQNELRTFFTNEYKIRGEFTYIQAYSILSFKKTLVLCPISVPISALKIERKRCIDMSGVEYKLFNKANYNIMK